MDQRLRRLGISLALGSLGSASAALIDRGGGLIYDTVLDVTWLQDANHAKTSGYDADGKMNWSAAMAWAADLSYTDSLRGVTYTDWRLPSTSVQVQGFNQTGSELGQLYYVALGNSAGPGAKNLGPFQNVFLPGEDWTVFWSSTLGVESTNFGWYTYAFTFIFNDGEQDTTDPAYFERMAWAVRDGDVSAIPEPGSLALVAAALVLSAGAAIQRQQVEESLRRRRLLGGARATLRASARRA